MANQGLSCHTGASTGVCALPHTFNVFINDLPEKLISTGKDDLFRTLHICCLLYADDLVVFAESAEDLQDLLLCLDEWCHT